MEISAKYGEYNDFTQYYLFIVRISSIIKSCQFTSMVYLFGTSNNNNKTKYKHAANMAEIKDNVR